MDETIGIVLLILLLSISIIGSCISICCYKDSKNKNTEMYHLLETSL